MEKLWKVILFEGVEAWDLNGFEWIQHHWQQWGEAPRIANLPNLTMFWGY